MLVRYLPCINGSVCGSASCHALIASEWVHNLYEQLSQTLELTMILQGLFMTHSLVLTIKLLTVLLICLLSELPCLVYQDIHCFQQYLIPLGMSSPLTVPNNVHPAPQAELRTSWPIKLSFTPWKHPCATALELRVMIHLLSNNFILRIWVLEAWSISPALLSLPLQA